MASTLVSSLEEPESVSKNKKKESSDWTSSVQLSVPNAPQDPSFAALRDESSSYAAVAKACLRLTQFSSDRSSPLGSQALLHDSSFCKTASAAASALTECLSHHRDPRCRIVACRTAAVFGRSAYARLRHSPLILSARNPQIGRLEDEVGTDIPAALMATALEDPDEDVSGTAIKALGIMSLSGAATGTLAEDSLLREVHSITCCRVAPYAPTNRAVVDEDPSISMTELQNRIYDNVASPRLLQLIDRISLYRLSSNIAAALPFVTAALVHHRGLSRPSLSSMDRPSYSKRWADIDSEGMMETVAQSLVLALMHNSSDKDECITAAMSALRLANANPTASWAPSTCETAVSVFLDDLNEETLTTEEKSTAIACAIIALRFLPLSKRVPYLWRVAENISRLPSTVVLPMGISTPALLQERDSSYPHYRYPCRIGLWTELALSFIIDGVGEGGKSSRADALKSFLVHPRMSQVLQADDNLSAPRDELFLVLTTTAIQAGRRFRVQTDGKLVVKNGLGNDPAYEEWLKIVWVILTSFVSRVVTGPSVSYLHEDLSLPTAGLAGYIQLLQEYLYAVGLLNPACSATVKLTTNACPPHILWDRMMDSAAFLVNFGLPDCNVSVDKTAKLIDELVSRELQQGVPSHHMRLFILSLAADHWVQGRFTVIKRNFDNSSSSSASLNLKGGKDIITACSPSRLLRKIFNAHEAPVKSKRDPTRKLAHETVRVCIACIENIVLAAIYWKRHFGSSEAKQIVSTALGVLQGTQDETPSDEMIQGLVAPLCEDAARRIQDFLAGEGSTAGDEFPSSELVSQPVRTKIRALISNTKPEPCPQEDFVNGYCMELSRQVILSRTQLAVESQRSSCSPLRLQLSQLPESSDGRLDGGPFFAIAAWEKLVKEVSSPSDPSQVLLACTPQRVLRLDGYDEFRLGASMRIINVTALDYEPGLRLGLGLSQVDGSQCSQASASSVSDVCVAEGDYLTWNVSINSRVVRSCSLQLHASLLYPDIPIERSCVGAQVVGKLDDAQMPKTDADESGEDDFQVTDNQQGGVLAEDVRVDLSVLTISPLHMFQPCPLVFFRDALGDYEVFRFLWFRMSAELKPITVNRVELNQSDRVSQKIAAMSQISWSGEAIPGGFAEKAWALSTLTGERVLGIYAEAESGEPALFFRGDSDSVLQSLSLALETVVSSLLPDMLPLS